MGMFTAELHHSLMAEKDVHARTYMEISGWQSGSWCTDHSLQQVDSLRKLKP